MTVDASLEGLFMLVGRGHVFINMIFFLKKDLVEFELKMIGQMLHSTFLIFNIGLAY